MGAAQALRELPEFVCGVSKEADGPVAGLTPLTREGLVPAQGGVWDGTGDDRVPVGADLHCNQVQVEQHSLLRTLRKPQHIFWC